MRHLTISVDGCIASKIAGQTCRDPEYAQALRLDGRDAGAPRLRPVYWPRYYGAFTLDPDGNKIEAVCGIGDSPSA